MGRQRPIPNHASVAVLSSIEAIIILFSLYDDAIFDFSVEFGE